MGNPANSQNDLPKIIPIKPVPPPPAPPEPPPLPPEPPLAALSKFTEGTLEWYRVAYKLCEIDKGYEESVKKNVKTILAGKERYINVEKVTGVPWYIIGCIHFKEASCNFAGVLHNGEKIIGTGKKTSIVPKGLGPFWTWEQAAVDALSNSSRWKKIKAGGREIGEILYACERYNGTGYISGAGKEETSPYLWARSNINDDKGKYVSDGKFDPEATTQKTTGLAVLIKELEKMGEIKLAS